MTIIPSICSKESVIILKPKVWESGVVNRVLGFIVKPLLFRIVSNELFNNNISPVLTTIWFCGQYEINIRFIRMHIEAFAWLHGSCMRLLDHWGNIWDIITVDNFDLKSHIRVFWNWVSSKRCCYLNSSPNHF